MTIKKAKFASYMGENVSITITDTDNNILSVPFDEANTDYQEYLEWAKTNTAEEAD